MIKRNMEIKAIKNFRCLELFFCFTVVSGMIKNAFDIQANIFITCNKIHFEEYQNFI